MVEYGIPAGALDREAPRNSNSVPNAGSSERGSSKERQSSSDTRTVAHRAHANVRFSLRIAIALVFIALTTFVLFHVVAVNPTTAGFLYLVAILLIATKGGLVESTIASVAAMLCFNFFFLPPIGTFTVADSQNWVALFAFLATSLTASQLSAHAKRRALEAEGKQREVERLYALSQGLLLIDTSQPVAKQIVEQITVACDLPEVALYLKSTDEIRRVGFDGKSVETRLRECAARANVLKDEEADQVFAPIQLGGEPIGGLALGNGAFSEAALQSLLNLVVIALERANSLKAVTQAEVARQSEELKSTLLDAIAHEFKTPLTSIKAITTDLLSGSPSPLTPDQHELISIVDESSDRLSKLVTDATQLARIEGGTFRLNLGVYFPSALVKAVLKQMNSVIEEREVVLNVPDALPPVRVDAGLIEVVLSNLLDNALKYSAASDPITIGARLCGAKVIMYLSDHGQGIEMGEQQQVFERFYRGKEEPHVPGSGMGLAIAREILRAHGEDIALISSPGQGSEFSFGLPIASEGFQQ